MSELNMEGLRQSVSERAGGFFRDLLNEYGNNIHSLHITGSAVTDDFSEKNSDINTVVVLNKMDLKFLEFLAPKGKKYRKMKVASPLIMTPEYIDNSKDVFPVEFLSIKVAHRTVYGEDVFSTLSLDNSHLRHQCEREVKVKLIGLRQGYLTTMGDARALTQSYIDSITGYIPLFRAIITCKDGEPPVLYAEVLRKLSEITGVDCTVYEKLLREKRSKDKLGKAEVDRLFEEYYDATAKLSGIINELNC